MHKLAENRVNSSEGTSPAASWAWFGCRGGRRRPRPGGGQAGRGHLWRGGATARRPSFTLIEVLVTIAIVMTLAAILLPAVQASRESARRAQCASQLRQLGVAAHSYLTAHEEFPPGVKQWYFNSSVSHRGIPLFAYLLPYLEEGHLLTEWDYDNPMKNVDQGAKSRTAAVLAVLVCPTDRIPLNPITVSGRGWTYGLTSYGGNGGTRSYFPERATADGIFFTTGEASEPKHYQQTVRASEVLDGLSNTVLFGERSHVDTNYETFTSAGWGDTLGDWGWWGASTSRKMVGHVTLSAYVPLNYQLPFDFDHRAGQHPPADSFANFQEYVERRLCAFGSSHPGGANFCLADGSVDFLLTEMEQPTLTAYCTRSAETKAARR